MSGATIGAVRIMLRLEGLCVLIASSIAYSKFGLGWGTFALFFLTPDLSFLGYLAGSRIDRVATLEQPLEDFRRRFRRRLIRIGFLASLGLALERVAVAGRAGRQRPLFDRRVVAKPAATARAHHRRRLRARRPGAAGRLGRWRSRPRLPGSRTGAARVAGAGFGGLRRRRRLRLFCGAASVFAFPHRRAD